MSDRDRADVPASSLTRRTFLGASATFAASALAGCNDPPPEHIVPYVERPRGVTPGRARWFATSALRNGVAVGIVGKTREGRPIKIEGNPRHPFSLGATGAVEQALPMTLYDADRLGAIAHRGTPATFEDFARAFGPSSGRAFVRGAGEGLHLWLPPTSSPLTAELLDRLRERYPRARIWYDPSLAPLSTWRATELVFGRPLAPHYHFERADRVLALDAEIGGAHPAALRWAAEWARRRRPEGSMSRCYAVCATPTGTSAAFDHRLAVRSSEIGALAAALLAALDVPGAPRALATFLERSPHRAWAEAVARDLAAHRGAALVIAGDRQPAPVHVIAALANAALGSVGRTVTYAEPPWLEAGRPAFEPAPLADALDAGEVDALLCLGGNPAYTASGTLRFAERAVRARELVALAEYPTETAALSSWVVPELHVLERWGDARAYDGTWSLLQPLLRPLFGGRTLDDVLLALFGDGRTVRGALRDRLARDGHALDEVLATGIVEGSASAPAPVAPRWEALGAALAGIEATPRAQRTFELDLFPDPRIGDGAQAENAWLEELPETITKLVWGNAAILADEDAAALGLSRGDVIELAAEEGSVRLPVLPLRGQARGAIATWLGYGRREGGRAARHVGVDAGALRTRADAWWIAPVRVRKTGARAELATTQHDFDLPRSAEVAIVLRETLARYARDLGFAERHDQRPPSLYPDRLAGAPQWGMTIDLNLCIGCQACVVACQAENNVPVVGKAQVRLGRAMHWLRIDRYEHPGAAQKTSLQPMLCQHCEKAPCEYVCPVNATVHSPDGLNEMVYNRCVGTRFCSNNCPYKIRRFNWYDWHAGETEPAPMKWNPDVSVRGRGVMEKCTYCVQRIRGAQIRARNEGRALRDGDVATACQQACPTGAIVFGDTADPSSRVARWQAAPRAYAVLDNLGTRPRTRYLARIDNENEDLGG